MRRVLTRLSLGFALLLGCREPFNPTSANPTWTAASHERVTPDFAVVFPDGVVARMDIILTADEWTAIRKNMTAIWGFDFGSFKSPPCCCPCPTDEPSYVNATVQF